MNKTDLEAILRNEPWLNAFGFGVFNSRRLTPQQRREQLEESRTRLLNDLATCQKVCDWLKANAVSRKTLNTKMGSYGWKHVVETEIGHYVTNGAFIAAAIHCGFNYKRCSSDSPNAYFNIREYKPAKAYSLV